MLLLFISMHYTDFYHDVLLESIDTGVSSESNIELTEAGYIFLRSQIDKLNKKASRWGVPPMSLRVIKEEFRKELKTVNRLTGEPADDKLSQFQSDTFVKKEVITKIYTVEVEGNPPRVEGYQFIAKVEHTEAGNLINYAPNLSEKDVPVEYRSAAQSCDVCHERRERNNTFILKLIAEDPKRFPNKVAGEFIMVGSACLKRFLPNISVKALVGYAELIENLRGDIDNSKSMTGGSGYGGINYITIDEVLLYLSAAYLISGKYISKSKADEYGGSSTLRDASTAMNFVHNRPEEKNPILVKLRDDSFKKTCEELVAEIKDWLKTKDFNAAAEETPQYSSLYKNLAVISKLEYTRSSNFNYIGAMFGIFLHDKKMTQSQETKPLERTDYLGTIGQKVTLNVEVKRVHEYQGAYGTGYIISMIGEEKTKDSTGNDITKAGPITYFSSNPILQSGEKATIIATVKNHQINNFTMKPETVITRAKVITT